MIHLDNVEFVVEGIFVVDDLEAWEVDLDLFLEGLPGSCAKVVVNRVACTFSDAS
jgi:hypothetical protein